MYSPDIRVTEKNSENTDMITGVLAAIRTRHISSTSLQRYGYVILPVFNVEIGGTYSYHFKGFNRYGV